MVIQNTTPPTIFDKKSAKNSANIALETMKTQKLDGVDCIGLKTRNNTFCIGFGRAGGKYN